MSPCACVMGGLLQVVLDDIDLGHHSMKEQFEGHFVHCDGQKGLGVAEADKAIQLLSGT